MVMRDSRRNCPQGTGCEPTFFREGDDAIFMKIRAHVFFGGLVQGVFFRANTVKCARMLGLTGWVRNSADGRVEAVFEGDDEAVKEAIEWCATKQPYAEVKSKEVKMSEATGEFEMFSVVP